MNTPGLSPLLLMLLAALFLAGLILLIRGLHGRRIGTDPHCRKCHYNLTGLTSRKCPECGTTLAPKTVLIGKPARRRGALATGLCLLLASATGLGLTGYGKLRTVNWYLYYPDSWLISAAERDVPKAMFALFDRVADHRMAPSHLGRAVDVALAKQAANPGFNTTGIWDGALARWYAAGAMDPTRIDRYFTRLTDATFHVRSLVVQGDPVVTTFSGCRAGAFELRERTFFRIVLTNVTLTFDEARNGESAAIETYWALPEFGSSTRYASHPELGAGVHTARVTGCWEVLPPPKEGHDQAPIWSRDLSMEREFIVWPADAPDPIQWIDDSALGEMLASRIRLDTVTASRSNLGRRTKCDLYFRFNLVGPLPVDVAFEATVMTQEGLSGAMPAHGYLVTHNGRSFDPLQVSATLHTLASEDDLYVLLTSSRAAMVNSKETYTAWEGSVLIGPIEIGEFKTREVGRFVDITREEFFEEPPAEPSEPAPPDGGEPDP